MELALIYARSASGDINQIIAQKRINEDEAIKNHLDTENLLESGEANTASIAEAIKSKRFDIIYVTDPTRITRNTDELLAIHQLADDHGVLIEYTRAEINDTITLLAKTIHN